MYAYSVMYRSICGAQFKHMGQQTTLGRYPIHAHSAGDAPDIYIGYNRLHELLHRCVVIHASSYVTVEWNVAHKTQGKELSLSLFNRRMH